MMGHGDSVVAISSMLFELWCHAMPYPVKSSEEHGKWGACLIITWKQLQMIMAIVSCEFVNVHSCHRNKNTRKCIFFKPDILERLIVIWKPLMAVGLICNIHGVCNTRIGVWYDVLWAGPRLNIKTVSSRYGDSHVKENTVARPFYL